MSTITETQDTVKFNGKIYNAAHGSPFDRGSADSWYDRGMAPHWYPNGSYSEPRIGRDNMTAEEIAEYYAGYEYNEQFGGKKEWD